MSDTIQDLQLHEEQEEQQEEHAQVKMFGCGGSDCISSISFLNDMISLSVDISDERLFTAQLHPDRSQHVCVHTQPTTNHQSSVGC